MTRRRTAHRSAVVLSKRIRAIRLGDGALRFRFDVPVASSGRGRRHDLIMLTQDGNVAIPPREWRPAKKEGSFRWSPAQCSCKTGGVPCAKCGRKGFLDPRKVGQLMAVRCFHCLRVYCFRCARGHFGGRPRGHAPAPGARLDVFLRQAAPMKGGGR